MTDPCDAHFLKSGLPAHWRGPREPGGAWARVAGGGKLFQMTSSSSTYPFGAMSHFVDGACAGYIDNIAVQPAQPIANPISIR